MPLINIGQGLLFLKIVEGTCGMTISSIIMFKNVPASVTKNPCADQNLFATSRSDGGTCSEVAIFSMLSIEILRSLRSTDPIYVLWSKLNSPSFSCDKSSIFLRVRILSATICRRLLLFIAIFHNSIKMYLALIIKFNFYKNDAYKSTADR